jgi:hypothetical protein
LDELADILNYVTQLELQLREVNKRHFLYPFDSYRENSWSSFHYVAIYPSESIDSPPNMAPAADVVDDNDGMPQS